MPPIPSRWWCAAPMGTSLGVAYDLGRPTTAVRYLLRDLTAIVLEANHDEVQLRTSEYPAVVQRRIAGSAGHLSNRAAAQLLAELHHPGLSVIVLAHLSQQCNTAEVAREEVRHALRRVKFRGAIHVAEQDTPLPPDPAGPEDSLSSSPCHSRLALPGVVCTYGYRTVSGIYPGAEITIPSHAPGRVTVLPGLPLTPSGTSVSAGLQAKA